MRYSFVAFVAMIAVAGGLLPVQSALNASLAGKSEGGVLWAALMSTTCSTIGLAIIAVLTLDRWPRFSVVREVPLWMWGGGVVGAVFVVTGALVIPRVGAGVYVAAVVLGQIMVSIVLDHNGWLGMPSEPLSIQRVLGVIAVFGGLLLVHGI